MYRLKTPNFEAFALTANEEEWPEWAREARAREAITPFPGPVGESGVMYVSGNEGRVMRADIGDWIVQDEVGALCPFKPADFTDRYELIP